MTESDVLTPKDLFIDSSALVELVCQRRYFFRCVLGLPQDTKNTLLGSAAHHYREKLDRGETPDIMRYLTKLPPKDAGVFPMLANTMENLELPPVAVDSLGQPFVEWSFCFPYCKIRQYTIHICGKVDRIDRPIGSLRLLDYKTSRKADKHAVLNKYTMRLQLHFYMYWFKHYLAHFFQEEDRTFINSRRFYAQILAIFAWQQPKIEYSPIVQQSDYIDSCIPVMLDDLLHKAVACHEADNILLPEGMVYGICDECSYSSICALRDENKIKARLPDESLLKPYDPRTHGSEFDNGDTGPAETIGGGTSPISDQSNSEGSNDGGLDPVVS